MIFLLAVQGSKDAAGWLLDGGTAWASLYNIYYVHLKSSWEKSYLVDSGSDCWGSSRVNLSLFSLGMAFSINKLIFFLWWVEAGAGSVLLGLWSGDSCLEAKN